MKLREIRKARGMSQEDLARVTPCARSTIANYETGIREPRLKDAKALAKALDCTVDELIGDPETEEDR